MFASTQIFGLAAMALSSVFTVSAAPVPAAAPALVEKDVGVLSCKSVSISYVPQRAPPNHAQPC